MAVDLLEAIFACVGQLAGPSKAAQAGPPRPDVSGARRDSITISPKAVHLGADGQNPGAALPRPVLTPKGTTPGRIDPVS